VGLTAPGRHSLSLPFGAVGFASAGPDAQLAMCAAGTNTRSLIGAPGTSTSRASLSVTPGTPSSGAVPPTTPSRRGPARVVSVTVVPVSPPSACSVLSASALGAGARGAGEWAPFPRAAFAHAFGRLPAI
jgi:hypothetical protein